MLGVSAGCFGSHSGGTNRSSLALKRSGRLPDRPRGYDGSSQPSEERLTDSIVVATDLTKSFGPKSGVFDVDLEIPKGKIVGFIGPSGSGKTTTVRLMTGLLKPDSGSLEVFGIAPEDFDSSIRALIGYMPQEAILYPDLTLAQNLRFASSLYGMGSEASSRIADLVDFLDLGEAVQRLPVEASGGERRRLMLAATLVHSPELLFLDEPTAGIDPVLRRRIWDRLGEVAEAGASLIVTTQYVGEAAYCDYVAVLAEGRVLLFETPEGLRRAAFGGEIIEVVFEQRVDRGLLAELEGEIDAELLERVDEASVRLVVDDGREASKRSREWSQRSGVAISDVEPHLPVFDDVFVAVVDRLTEEGSDDSPLAGEGGST